MAPKLALTRGIGNPDEPGSGAERGLLGQVPPTLGVRMRTDDRIPPGSANLARTASPHRGRRGHAPVSTEWKSISTTTEWKSISTTEDTEGAEEQLNKSRVLSS